MAYTAHSKEEEREFLDDEAALDRKVTQLAEWILESNHFACAFEHNAHASRSAGH